MSKIRLTSSKSQLFLCVHRSCGYLFSALRITKPSKLKLLSQKLVATTATRKFSARNLTAKLIVGASLTHVEQLFNISTPNGWVMALYGYANNIRCDNQLQSKNPPALFPRILRNTLDELYQLWYNSLHGYRPNSSVVFFQTASGREPVREFLKDLDKEDRKDIGEDIKLVQFRWPLEYPSSER